tara:strand:+ start:176 stop:1003 length:828 start_codon:yes stop_codon:yes gene_type:complete
MYIYIIPHQGLGDILCTNGLIRHLIEINPDAKRYYLFCMNMHVKTAKFQFRDLKKLKIISISNNEKNEKKEIETYIKKQKKEYEIIKIGHDFYNASLNLNPYKKNYPWHCCVAFYKQFGLPYKVRFQKTYWKRDLKREKKLFQKLTKNKKNYVFVHDDKKRGINIDTSKINKNYSIIRNNNDYLVFDYGLILENAKELHLMESSFRQLTETLKIKTKKLFLYKDDREDYSMPLYNKEIKKFVGTSKMWKEIKVRWNDKNFIKPHVPTEKSRRNFF